jgi:hypothetical protein
VENMNWNEKWGSLVERSWSDPKFHQDLMDNPNRVLAAAGMKAPDGVNLVVVENEPNRIHLVLPARPAAGFNRADDAESALTQYSAAVVF